MPQFPTTDTETTATTDTETTATTAASTTAKRPPDWPQGEVAFVTGAASGIGLGISRAFVARGARVALADIDEDRLAAVAHELREAGGTVTTVRLDVSDPAAWEAAADAVEAELGPVTVLCGNAGVNGGSSAESTPWEVWRWVHAINLDAQFLGVATFLPRFRAHGRPAHILNTASMAGIVPMADVAAYASSKFAGIGFSMVLRTELTGSGIDVSVLAPGSVATRIAETGETGQAKLLGREENTEVARANAALLAQGADPNAVGAQVVEAMGAGQFLIITHKEWLPLVRSIHDEIEQAFVDFDGRHGIDPAAALMAQGENPVSS